MDFVLENNATLLFAMGVLIMIVLLMRRWNRYYKRQRTGKGDVRRIAMAERDPDRQQPLLDAPPEILRWQVEMHDTARDLKAELDTKIAVLQRLSIDAHLAAERLEKALDRSDDSSDAAENDL